MERKPDSPPKGAIKGYWIRGFFNKEWIELGKPKSKLTKRFAQNLKSARENRGLSQKALAKQAGINSSLISRMERGLSSPRLDAVNSLAIALGVEATDLQKGIVRKRLIKG